MATNSVLGYDLSDAKDPTDSIPDQAHSQPPVSVRSSGVLSSQTLSHASQAICLGPATAYQLNAILLDGDTDVLDALSVLHRRAVAGHGSVEVPRSNEAGGSRQ